MKKTAVEKHFDDIAKTYNFYKEKNRFYYDNLKKLISDHVPKGSKVLEVGCGTGDLIAHLNPKKGWGMDISKEMTLIAKKRYDKKRSLRFSTKWPDNKYDYILMSDVIEHLEDPDETFKNISERMSKKSVFLLTMANPIWEPILLLAEKMGLKMPEGPHKRISYRKLKRKIERSQMRVIKHDYSLLLPVNFPYITGFVNKYLEPYFKRLAFIEYMVVVKT
jgi:ubiquinone/menaquinone biosynthesis C-methylase UbiE